MSDAPLPDPVLPDGALLRRYQAGDEAAFAELRRRHGRLVLATCRREIGNAETGDTALAEDAAQGAFLLLSRKRLPEDASLAGWLHSAARGTARNLVRTERRRAARERHAFEAASAPEIAWNALSPHVDAALAALRPRDREAILLRYAGERSLAEVGQALGTTENAARMSVARALERLRGQLGRAGVGVPVALLATLLGARLADAETPLAPGTPPAIGPRPRPWSSSPVALPLALALLASGIAVIGLGIAVRRAYAPLPRLSEAPLLAPAERDRLLAALPGGWRGDLEYADDVTGERVRTRTDVSVVRRGAGLRLTASYPNYSVVDVTEIIPAAGGRFLITTGGPENSHRLDGTYELVRLPDGTSAFSGASPTLRARVHLRVVPGDATLTIAEEVERGGTFRFRNRFDLRRSP